MTKNNENLENNNSWMAWATGKLAMFAIGLAAGYFLYQTGMLQKVTGKIFSKKPDKKSNQEEESSY
ncbi:MAG: hypothetical protein MRERV_1c119 [Mycoplasmataceae bacterium RV_VA103A]|nr:MAG: hypothetical protein MRERV_1c119 [Mycoplasmataceae bacterium RV_VA103A]